MTNYILSLIAQLTPAEVEKFTKVADELSDKNFKWWFAAVFVILLSGGAYIIKLLIAQLGEQRQTNADERKEMLVYMRDDRLKVNSLLERVTSVLERLEEDKRMNTLTNMIQSSPSPSVQAVTPRITERNG